MKKLLILLMLTLFCFAFNSIDSTNQNKKESEDQISIQIETKGAVIDSSSSKIVDGKIINSIYVNNPLNAPPSTEINTIDDSNIDEYITYYKMFNSDTLYQKYKKLMHIALPKTDVGLVNLMNFNMYLKDKGIKGINLEDYYQMLTHDSTKKLSESLNIIDTSLLALIAILTIVIGFVIIKNHFIFKTIDIYYASSHSELRRQTRKHKNTS